MAATGSGGGTTGSFAWKVELAYGGCEVGVARQALDQSMMASAGAASGVYGTGDDGRADLISVDYRSPPKARVAVVHPGLGFGGSEAPALWTLAALKGLYHVTLITLDNIDLDRLNAYYGTKLCAQDFNVQRAPLPHGVRRPGRFAALRGRFSPSATRAASHRNLTC